MSGIYIPGLSVPRKTGIVSIVLSGDGSALLCEDGAYSEIKVIPVPDHGRLIDADALAKCIKDEGRNQAEYYADRYAPVVLAYGDCYGNVQSAPTIIPASGGKENE